MFFSLSHSFTNVMFKTRQAQPSSLTGDFFAHNYFDDDFLTCTTISCPIQVDHFPCLVPQLKNSPFIFSFKRLLQNNWSPPLPPLALASSHCPINWGISFLCDLAFFWKPSVPVASHHSFSHTWVRRSLSLSLSHSLFHSLSHSLTLPPLFLFQYRNEYSHLCSSLTPTLPSPILRVLVYSRNSQSPAATFALPTTWLRRIALGCVHYGFLWSRFLLSVRTCFVCCSLMLTVTICSVYLFILL